MEASHRLLQVQIWSEYQFEAVIPRFSKEKKAEKESRGTLEYFVRLSGPENEVLAVANYGFGEHAAYSSWVILAAAD